MPSPSMNSILKWILVFQLGISAVGEEPERFAETVFSSNDHSTLFYPIWSYWHRGPDSWVFLIPGNRRENQGLTVWTWPDDGPATMVAKTSAREGVFLPRVSALTPSGNDLYFRGFASPIMLKIDLQDPKGFKRAFVLEQSDAVLFWDEERLVSGGKYPELSFKIYGDNQAPISLIESMGDQIPKDIDHPIEPYYVQNQMLLAKDGERMAVAFGLYEEVMVWDGLRRRYFHISFPGYAKPPWKNPKNFHTPTYRAWFGKFHHLYHLTWFQGELYAMFRKGYDDLGVWVQFVGGGGKLVWDNNRENIRIFAMEKDGLILGENILDDEEEVQWRLWQASSLPSR